MFYDRLDEPVEQAQISRLWRVSDAWQLFP